MTVVLAVCVVLLIVGLFAWLDWLLFGQRIAAEREFRAQIARDYVARVEETQAMREARQAMYDRIRRS